MITRTTCRVCKGDLQDAFSLGDHYVSDFPLPAQPDGVKAPLELMLCRTCSLLQLRHTVPADTMYRNYWYRSGTNSTMREALGDIALAAERLMHLGRGDAVLDIGCNDGTLLGAYRTPELFKIGFDPAENLAPLSRAVANRIFTGFFKSSDYMEDRALRAIRPKVVTSIAMFYDLEDPGQFAADVQAVMDEDGLWIVQMSYLPMMLANNDVGNICHEHLEYYSLRSFEHLLGMHEMEIVDVEINDVNGGSFRLYVRNRKAKPELFGDGTYRSIAADRIERFRKEEVHWRLDEPDTYREFSQWVDRIKSDVAGFIGGQVKMGKRVFVYGASTKGNTILQYFGLDRSLITAAVERNPDKCGRETVGTRIPIVAENDARAARPHYLLVLPWHFLREFMEREKQYLLGGGRFIVPMPHFSLI